MKNQTEPMEASRQFCPHLECKARGEVGQGNIVIHGCKRPRYRWKTCGKTFSAKEGTLFAGLRKPIELIVIVGTLLAYGCPVQAIVHAYGLDERTVASWRDRAGKHCQPLHPALVEQGQLDLLQVQADENRVKGRLKIVWMGLAMMVSTRLGLAGTVSVTRDRQLADQLLQQVRRSGQALGEVLVGTDGWAAYPASIKRGVREKVKRTTGRGRACLELWSGFCLATVLKRTQKKRVVEVIRTLTWGTLEQASKLLQACLGGNKFNTAFIERFNGTMRERLASLTRKSRHGAHRLEALETGMYLIGCTYNCCVAHHELSSSKHAGSATTPARAAGLTDHLWSICEVLSYKLAPAPWVEPRRRGRPRTPPCLIRLGPNDREAVLAKSL